MGIYDREYYRDETRGSGWLSGVAPATKALILINVGVYIAQVVFADAQLEQLFAAQSPGLFRNFRLWQLVTAAFLHDPSSPFHILFNMMFLWMAGREVESLYGSREFVAFYVLAAVSSTLAWALLAAVAPGGGPASMLGASGPVIATMMLYTLFHPRREVIFFFILPVEMWLLMVILLGCDFVYLMQQLHGHMLGAGVAFSAHLAGAAYAYGYKASGVRWTRLIDLRGGRRPAPRLRVVKPEMFDRDVDSGAPASTSASKPMAAAPMPKAAATLNYTDEQFEARFDEVLAKIARDGNRDGLTEEEHRILQEASRRARDRRSDRVR